jgi:nicotinamidase-related amidase
MGYGDGTWLTGDICVLFTANDAYIRDFRLVVPADCVASAVKAPGPKSDHMRLVHSCRGLC